MESDAVAQTIDTKKSISHTVGQFYRYSFLYGKGEEVAQVLPAMCSKNNFEEHIFKFLKSIWQNHYLFNDSGQAWAIERNICELLHFANLTCRGSQSLLL